MKMHNRNGFSLLELLISLSIVGVVGTMVFTGMSQMALNTLQDEANQHVRDSLTLAMGHIRRDVQLATNVVDYAGNRYTGGSTLVLRQPVVENGALVEDAFQYVSYTSDGKFGGLLREVWEDPDDTQPIDSTWYRSDLRVLTFAYDGKSYQHVESYKAVNQVDMMLTSVCKGPLTDPNSKKLEQYGYGAATLEAYAEEGVSFTAMSDTMSAIRTSRDDLLLESSISSARLRNRRALGL